MKRLLLLLISTIMVMGAFALTIDHPVYRKVGSDNYKITKITTTPKYTIVMAEYYNPKGYQRLSINKATYLLDKSTGMGYPLINTIGLPMSPDFYFTRDKMPEILRFSLYFSPVPNAVQRVDLVERPLEEGSFNVYDLEMHAGNTSASRPSIPASSSPKDDIVYDANRKFKVWEEPGQLLTTKPALGRRLDGIEEIQVYVPTVMTGNDAYIYEAFKAYLKRLGLKVDVQPMKTDKQYGSIFILPDDPGEYLDQNNKLIAILNYVSSFAKTEIRLAFHDYVNGYTWEVPYFTMANEWESMIGKFAKNVKSYHYYDPSKAFVAPSVTSNWSRELLLLDVNNQNFDELEGVYLGGTYELGLKKDEDGYYYLIYIKGGINTVDWKEGDVKAKLVPTASPYIYKAIWYGKWKQPCNHSIYFTDYSMIVEDENGHQDKYLKMYPTADMLKTLTPQPKGSTSTFSISSGTGFLLSTDGYIVTNHHVIEDAEEIVVSSFHGGLDKKYHAEVVISDAINDLAILKIQDKTFAPFIDLPYSFEFRTQAVGQDCFVLGYPLVETMGTEIKLTTGVVSAKTGFQGNVSQYQISAPIQPGNSGAPLFNKDGNVVGVVSSKHLGTENVGYAIKSSYIRNLVDLLDTPLTLPETSKLKGKNRVQQVQAADDAICLIFVRSK